MANLDGFFADLVEDTTKPSGLEMVHYLFWEKGIDLSQITNLPLPYILGIIKTHNYVQKEQEKELKRKK